MPGTGPAASRPVAGVLRSAQPPGQLATQPALPAAVERLVDPGCPPPLSATTPRHCRRSSLCDEPTRFCRILRVWRRRFFVTLSARVRHVVEGQHNLTPRGLPVRSDETPLARSIPGMQSRRHRMRQRQRRDSAREWIGSGVAVTVKSTPGGTASTGTPPTTTWPRSGFALPASAQQWAQRPPATPRRTAEHRADRVEHEPRIVLDGRLFFVVGYTSGGAPYGMFGEEMEPYDGPP